MSSIDPAKFESEMWSAVGDLEGARRALDAATQQLAEQRHAVSAAMQRYGAALAIEGSPVRSEIIRSLYWEHRDIRASAIAEAFAIQGGGGRVHEYVGSEPFETPCAGGCGRHVRMKARTAPVPMCDECSARIASEREATHQEWVLRDQQEREERREWTRAQLLDGRTPEELYVEMTERWVIGSPLESLRDLAAMVEAENAGVQPF